MSMTWNVHVAGALGAVAVLLAVVLWRFAFFIAPMSWTAEPERLAEALALGPGASIADVGAGSGAMALAMAQRIGATGRVYATELPPDRLAALEQRMARAGAANVTVVGALGDETGLPDGCCDAVYLRTVLHHVSSRAAFARSVRRALRPHGRLAIIDFAPGALWFHGADHGVRPSEVVETFTAAGLRLQARTDEWGGGTYLLVFERA